MALWDEFDVLMTPGLAKTAIAAEGGFGRPAPLAIDIAGRFTPFTPLFNLTGQPAVIAAGRDRRATGCRSACSSSAGGGRRTCCSRSPGSSKPARPWADRRPPLAERAENIHIA